MIYWINQNLQVFNSFDVPSNVLQFFVDMYIRFVLSYTEREHGSTQKISLITNNSELLEKNAFQ